MSTKRIFKIDKLIRDKLPARLQAKNIEVCTRMMEEAEYVERLKDKLLEEAQEAIRVTSKADFQEELADLLEVIHAICLAHELSYEEIETARCKKKIEKGGFETRIYSEFVEMEIDNPSITYYLDNPDKYPELS